MKITVPLHFYGFDRGARCTILISGREEVLMKKSDYVLPTIMIILGSWGLGEFAGSFIAGVVSFVPAEGVLVWYLRREVNPNGKTA